MNKALTVLTTIAFIGITSNAYSEPDYNLTHSGDPNITHDPDLNIKECRTVRWDSGTETNIADNLNNNQTTDMGHTFKEKELVSVLDDDDPNNNIETKYIDFDPNKARIWSASCHRGGLRGGVKHVVDTYPARAPYEGTAKVTCDRGGIPVDSNADRKSVV